MRVDPGVANPKFTALVLVANDTGDWTVVVVVACTGDASPVSLLTTEAVLLTTVPFVTAAPTATVRVSDWMAAAFMFPIAQVTVPPLLVPGALAETNVVFAGTTSVTETPVRAWVPLFVTTIV